MSITRQAQLARLDKHNAEMLARFSREAEEHTPLRPGLGRTPAGDGNVLRMIPAIGRGVGGAIPGTRP